MNVIFLGPPGAGKGTQANLLSRKFGLKHFSTGEILREAVAQGTALGIQVKAIMEKGQLVTDSIVNDLVEESILSLGRSDSFILDGYPRNLMQANFLDNFLEKNNKKISYVFSFTVSPEILLERVANRANVSKSNSQSRKDDTPEILSARLKSYDEETKPLLKFYGEQAVLVEIDAMKEIDEVFADISKYFV